MDIEREHIRRRSVVFWVFRSEGGIRDNRKNKKKKCLKVYPSPFFSLSLSLCCAGSLQKKRNLLIEHVNAQSLLCNFDEIKSLIYERNIDILCISESWLLAHTPDSHVHIPNFDLHRHDGGKGDGVCVYVINELN